MGELALGTRQQAGGPSAILCRLHAEASSTHQYLLRDRGLGSSAEESRKRSSRGGREGQLLAVAEEKGWELGNI